MSAICGLVNFDGAPVDPDLLRRMAESAVHHGPDGICYWIEGNVGLAHLAFNTTPESLRESQPLLTDDGTLCLVADGRIDNRPELIYTLSRQGFPITNNTSDAGLILAAYQHWGEAAPNQLIGDFAFAIWDKQQQRLFCASDIFGIKPIVYSQVGSLFCFATEAQQILQHPAISPKLDEIRVADFLAVNNQDQVRTFFANVRFIPPAHSLMVEQNQLFLKKYQGWELEDQLSLTDSDAYIEQFQEIFTRTVQDRLRTVAPIIGINMSGGLDSSSIAAVANGLLPNKDNRRLVAQTLIYNDNPFEDERKDSRLIADFLGIHINFITNDDVPLLNKNGIVDPESPYRGWEQTEKNLVEHFRTQGGQILLTGIGGDDLVGGSALVHADQLRRGDLLAIGRLWHDAHLNRKSFWKIIYSWFIRPRLPQVLKNRRLKDQGSNPLSASIPIWIPQDFARRTNLTQRLRSQPPIQSKSWARQVIHQSVSQMGDVYRMYLHWQSRLATRQQVDYRHPFLDRRLCKFVLRLPPEKLWQAGLSKYILRQAMVNKLPEKIRLRPIKTTYAAITHQQLRDKEARQISQLLENPLVVKLGFVNSQKLQEGLRAYFSGQQDGRSALTLIRLVSLEIWLLNHSFLQL